LLIFQTLTNSRNRVVDASTLLKVPMPGKIWPPWMCSTVRFLAQV